MKNYTIQHINTVINIIVVLIIKNQFINHFSFYELSIA